jgi:hypothetical protein
MSCAQVDLQTLPLHLCQIVSNNVETMNLFSKWKSLSSCMERHDGFIGKYLLVAENLHLINDSFTHGCQRRNPTVDKVHNSALVKLS